MRNIYEELKIILKSKQPFASELATLERRLLKLKGRIDTWASELQDQAYIGHRGEDFFL